MTIFQFLQFLSDNEFQVIVKEYAKIGVATESTSELKFIPESAFANTKALTFNKERANISLLVKIDGKVVNFPKNDFGISEYQTFIWRNFNIIRDGELNVKNLVFVYDNNLKSYLHSNGIGYAVLNNTIEVDLSLMDLTDRKPNEVNAETLAFKFVQLEFYKALNKVYNHFNPKDSEVLTPEQEFIKELGITSNGFAPKVERKEVTETYKAVTIQTKIKSLSSLPSVSAVLSKIESGKKLTLSESVIKAQIDIYNDYSKKELETVPQALKNNIKRLTADISKALFDLLVAEVGFEHDADYASIETIVGTFDVNFEYVYKEFEK